jgi:hypothetical protein
MDAQPLRMRADHEGFANLDAVVIPGLKQQAPFGDVAA